MITYQYCSCGRTIPEIFRWIAKKYHFIGKCVEGCGGKLEPMHEPCDYYFSCGFRTIQQQLLQLWKLYEERRQIPPYRWIGGIMGSDKVVSKNGLWSHFIGYYQNRDELEEWMPPTYLLASTVDKMEFAGRYNSASARGSSKKFIFKKNIQRKEGILIYDGSMCRGITSEQWDNYCREGYVVIQELIEKVGLVQGYKVNLRVYMLVTVRRGKIRVYYHSLGKCLYAKKQLGASPAGTRTHEEMLEEMITSYHWDDNRDTMDAFYAEMPHSWAELAAYVGGCAGSNSVSTRMNKQIIKIIRKLKRLMRTVCEMPDSWWRIMQFQLFGLDFLFDEEWNPHLLEINKGPDMQYKCAKDVAIKRRVYEDVYRTVGMIPSLEESLYVEV